MVIFSILSLVIDYTISTQQTRNIPEQRSYLKWTHVLWPKVATSIFKHHMLQNLPPAKQQSPISHRIYYL